MIRMPMIATPQCLWGYHDEYDDEMKMIVCIFSHGLENLVKGIQPRVLFTLAPLQLFT